MTLYKLSLRNARRQARDYLVYFVTIVLAAALMYAFNALVFSEELHGLSVYMDIQTTVILASIVVVCIIGWLVSYTTRFMLTRRSRELGTYLLIGLENRQVARMFFVENLVVGGCALVLGLLLGGLLYQILRAMVMHLFGLAYPFALGLDFRAVGLTLVYVLCLYVLAQGRSRRQIRKMKIHDLLYFDRQNETAVIQSSKRRRRMFVLSLVLGVAGTVLILSPTLIFGLMGAACIIAFLYTFFLSFASGVPAFFEKRPAKKYRGQNLLVFRTLTSKLATMGVVMATISLLFTGVLIAEGEGSVFSALFQGRAEQYSSFDLFVATTDPAWDLGEYQEYIQANIPVEDSYEYGVRWGDSDQVTRYLQDNAIYFRYYEKDLVLSYHDYAALRRLQGYPAVELRPGECLIHCMPYLEEAFQDYDEPIPVGGVSLKRGSIHTERLGQYGWDGNGGNFILVVSDEIAETCPLRHQIYVANTAQPVQEACFNDLIEIRDHRQETRSEAEGEWLDFDSVHSKFFEEAEAASMIVLIVFPLYYLAIILIMTAAAILTIQQLSEARHYRRQFELLRKLGMDRGEMGKALGRQFAIFYAMPVLPAVLVSMPMVWHTGWLAEPGIMYGWFAPPVIVTKTLLLFFLIYGLYILLAYSSMKRNVLPD